MNDWMVECLNHLARKEKSIDLYTVSSQSSAGWSVGEDNSRFTVHTKKDTFIIKRTAP